ncbi:MAG: FHA domain-containing protein [Deltaproteobacteria bacterium]|nr:FHA domain-containing protein [Deltaproteobacteria bacterium]
MALTLAIVALDPTSDSGGVDPPATAAPEWITFDQPRVVIGRSAGADVRLPLRSVSATHCALRYEAGEWSILDENSSNGTLVNGALLVRTRRKVLKHGDRITVPGYALTVSLDAAVASPTDRTATIARKLLADTLAMDGNESSPPYLVLRSGRKPGSQQWELSAQDTKLMAGREPGIDIVLDDVDCSRQHALFVRDEQGVVVRDLGSKNGIAIAGRRVTERRLRDGDEVHLGRVILSFHDPAEALLRAFDGGTDEPQPVQPLRPATIPPPSLAPPAQTDATASESAGAKKTDLPAKSQDPGVVRAVSEPAVRRRSLDWVVATLAIVILGMSVAALLLLLRTR